MVLAIIAGLQVFSLVTVRDGYTRFGPALGGDFAGFYSAGRIVNEHAPAQLYDLRLQAAL